MYFTGNLQKTINKDSGCAAVSPAGLGAMIWSTGDTALSLLSYPFPIVYAGSNAQSQTDLEEEVTTGNLTLPKPKELLSAWELEEKTQSKSLYCCSQLLGWLLRVKKSKI